jgi:methionine sulfoxide reductase heme-binding subunit
MKSTIEKSQEPVLAFSGWVGVLLGGLAGALLSIALLPSALPDLIVTLTGAQPSMFWFLARSSAWAAYMLLWSAMALGLMITSKTAKIWPGGLEAFELHKFVSLLALAMSLFHAFILLGDSFLPISLGQILVPFSVDAYQPFWVGVGQLCAYSLGLLCLSFYVRRRITQRVWRLIHFLSFFTFAGVLFHAVNSGTDAGSPAATLVFVATCGALLMGMMYRIMNAGSRTPHFAETPVRERAM